MRSVSVSPVRRNCRLSLNFNAVSIAPRPNFTPAVIIFAAQPHPVESVDVSHADNFCVRQFAAQYLPCQVLPELGNVSRIWITINANVVWFTV